jgi:tetratricopeptide (TPR) repeat protein
LIFEKGNFKDALVDFKKATDFKPDFNQAWFNQAICNFYLKDYQNAKFALEKAKATGIKNFQQFEQMLSAYN